MKLNQGDTAYDFLAVLCSMLPKEQERKCAIKWKTAGYNKVEKAIKEYQKYVDIILKSSLEQYALDDQAVCQINQFLEQAEEPDEQMMNEIYLLAVRIEKQLSACTELICEGMVTRLKPLNRNYRETGISIYPYFAPEWDTGKSERNREYLLNTEFANHIMIRAEDESPFEIAMHYWNDTGLLRRAEQGWSLKIAITPVHDSLTLKTREEELEEGTVLCVEGVEDEEKVEERIQRIFATLFTGEYSIIIFPEAVGTAKVEEKIKETMRFHPEYCTFVLLPTYCENGDNILTVLGPGGLEVLRTKKGTPFIMQEDTGILKREKLNYTNVLNILVTRELGNVAFPVCAELVDPACYDVLCRVGRADTILCPSYSPGIGAFEKTLMKGIAAMMMGVWVNTCSARYVSRSGNVSDVVGMVQIPDGGPEGETLHRIRRECSGKCRESGCFFEIVITCEEKTFRVQSKMYDVYRMGGVS